jgi:hypothetical protein
MYRTGGRPTQELLAGLRRDSGLVPDQSKPRFRRGRFSLRGRRLRPYAGRRSSLPRIPNSSDSPKSRRGPVIPRIGEFLRPFEEILEGSGPEGREGTRAVQ